MGRNVASQESPSFAGLMDHLTGFSRGSAPDSEFGATFRRNSKPDSAAVDESLTNPRNGARPMLPVTERRPAGSAPQADAAVLSYEKALQIHGRRRNPPASALGQARANLPTNQTTLPARDNAFGVRKASLVGKQVEGQSKTPIATENPSPSAARSSAKHQPQAPRSSKPPGSALPEKAAPAVPRRKTAVAPSSIPKPVEEAARLAPDRKSPKSQRKAKLSRGPHRESIEDAQPSAAGREISRGTIRGRQVQTLETAVEVLDAASHRSQLELLQAFSQTDQRRTIVSVRLTEGEFACLRDRAEESGISVSAYMRSCVVDADQLRAQVKRALAEMRSLSATGPGSGKALATSRKRFADDSAWNTQSWFRLVLRPFVFLFGPLFPARRST